MVVSFSWEDLRSGDVRVKRTNFTVTDSYLPHEPFGETFFQGSEALINKLARQIVQQLESDFPDSDS